MRTRVRFFAALSIVCAVLSLAGCGGHSSATGGLTSRQRISRNIGRAVAALRPALEELGVPSRGRSRHAMWSPAQGREEGEYPIPVDGYDEDLQLWFDGTWAPWEHHFTYYGDQAKTINAGSENYTEPNPVVWPLVMTYERTITYGPNQVHDYWQRIEGGDGSWSVVTDFTGSDGIRFQYSAVTTAEDVTTISTTTTFPSGLTVNGSVEQGENGLHTVSWLNSSGEEGFFNITPDNSGAGAYSEPAREGRITTATLEWGSDWRGTITYLDGRPDPVQPWTFAIPSQ